MLRVLATFVLLASSVGADALQSAVAPLEESRFAVFTVPESMSNAHLSGEPTIGIPPNTDHVFFQAYTQTYRATFTPQPGGNATVEWEDVTPDFTVANVDPMLHVDQVSNRIFAGGLAGPCSLMGISDDDAESWTPALNMCSGAEFDHQSIGSGPWSAEAPDSAARASVYPRATYYCGQAGMTACATSLDGGRTWLPFTQVLGGCGGLHGHIEVSESTGHAAVPHGGCSSGKVDPLARAPMVGFAFSADNGATWTSRVMPDSTDGNGFDPAVAFSRASGWLWIAQADEAGVHVAMSKDEGATWETLGATTGGAVAATWLDLAPTFVDPVTGQRLVYGAFPDLEAGDDERVALSFLATTEPVAQYPFTQCGPSTDLNIWHYYVALSLDAGATWTTTRILEDPVQVGGIWNAGGGAPCRNLLDFTDMDIDSKGRIHIAFADGCTGECAQTYANWRRGQGPAPTGDQSRDALGTILRQETGPGLFAEFDAAPAPQVPPTRSTASSVESPAATIGILVILAGVAALGRRRGSCNS